MRKCIKSKRILMAPAFLGCVLILNAAYIPVKAQLAQWLLENAWQHTLQTGQPTMPWSWADTYPVAKIEVARLGIQQIVLAGSSGKTLAFGPGVIANGADFKAQLNTVISGHRDTHFAWLRDLQVNDEFTLTLTNGESFIYHVVNIDVIHQSEVERLDKYDHDGVRLLTCYPFDSVVTPATLRLIVDAQLTTYLSYSLDYRALF